MTENGTNSKGCVMDLHFKTDDGSYHKLSEITEIEETIMDADDKLFNDPEKDLTVRRLKENGYFEQELHFDVESGVAKELLDKINAQIDELAKRHFEYYDLMWVCELAKRWLKEHVGNDC